MCQDLDEQILLVLEQSEVPLKAKEIARRIRNQSISIATKRDINLRLYSKFLYSRCIRDSDYKWNLAHPQNLTAPEKVSDNGPRNGATPSVLEARVNQLIVEALEYIDPLQEINDQASAQSAQQKERPESNIDASESLESALAKARQSFEKGHFEEVVSLLNPLVTTWVLDKDLFLLRGIALRFTNKNGLAHKDLSHAIMLESECTDAYMHRGQVNASLNHLKKAELDFHQVLDREPRNAEAHFQLGVVHMRRCGYRAAIKSFTESLLINPHYMSALVSRAQCRVIVQQYESAIADFSDALRQNTSDAGVYFQRALAYFALEQYRKALHDCEESLILGNTSLDAKRIRDLCKSAIVE